VQTILAGLQLNPVMNLITVSFALVISVIAATTVFRNVFIASDSFSGELRGFAGIISPAHEGPFRLQSGARSEVVFNHNISTEVLSTNETPHVVDVETDQGSAKGTRCHQNVCPLDILRYFQVAFI
jgi:hypothetical protein